MFKKKFNVIFVISGVIASFWRVFIKFRWHGQKLTGAESLLSMKILCECSVWGFNKVRRSEIEWSSHFWGRVLFCHSGRAAFNAVKLTMITVKKRTYCSIISLFISTGPHAMTALNQQALNLFSKGFAIQIWCPKSHHSI